MGLSTAIQKQRLGRAFRPNAYRAKVKTVPASVWGWDQLNGLANMPPDHAIQLDNFIPRPGYLEIRRGYEEYATGIGSGAVETIMSYNGPTKIERFATGNNGTIYDITGGGAGIATTVTGLANQRLQYTNFTGVDGAHYIFTANGVDAPRSYNGTTWASMGVTYAGGSQNDIIQWNGFKGHLFGIKTQSTKFIYGTVGQITGAFSVFDLGPLMTRGGYIVACATWSIDSKQTIDDYAIFITSRGQCIVYQGTDPASADTWALVSNFWIGPPIGQRCFLQIGGDLAVISIDGLLPISQMISSDRAAAGRTAFSANIMNAMNMAARSWKNNFGWQLISYPRGQLAIMNIPITENDSSQQFVMNTLTGAWCRFTNLNANVWEVSNDVAYFGGNDGEVNQWDIGSGDGDSNVTATVQTAFNYFGSRGVFKKFNTIRPIITSDGSVTPGVGINVDYGSGASVSVPATVASTGAQWDSGIWDASTWGTEGGTTAYITTISGIGTCASVITTLATANNGLADGVILRINAWDMTFEPAPGAGL